MSAQSDTNIFTKLTAALSSILIGILRLVFFRKKHKKSVTGEPSDEIYTLF
jgi:hypothetical protein